MKIGFIIHRTLYYKYFGSIIDEALKREHEVVCLHDHGSPSKTGGKGYQFPYLETIPQFRFGKPQSIAFNSDQELCRLAQEHNVQVLLSLHFFPRYKPLYKQLKKQGIFWVALQGTGGDTMMQVEYFDVPDRYLISSDTWLSLAVHYLARQGKIKEQDIPEHKEKLKSKVKSIGFPQIEQLNMVNQEEVKKEWGIPREKSVVLYLPFPCLKGRKIKIKTRLAYRRWDKKIVKALKQFSVNNNAYLLVKTRKKNPIARYLKREADKVLYDEEFYPATIMKCLKVADVCINFLSAVVTEAVSAGVPNICIAPTPDEWEDLRGPFLDFWEMMFKKGKQLYDFKGVSYMLSIPEAIKALSEKSIKDFPFNQERQKEYIKKFVGDSDGRYSWRVLNEIEILVSKPKIS